MTVTIKASKDNTLYEDANGELSNGRGKYFFAGKTGNDSISRGLTEFNVGSIPAEATITSARPTLYMSKTPTGATTVSLHRVSREWGEGGSQNVDGNGGEGAGGPAATGDATWVHTSFPSGGWNSLGGDFGSSSSSTSVSGNGFYTWGSTAAMVADVQRWVDNGGRNHGWLLKGDEGSARTAKRFDSRQNSNSSHRPLLTVTYILP